MKKKLLVVVAHADDEVLGAGGTIRKRVLEGWEAKLLVCTEGVSGRFKSNNLVANESIEDQKATRHLEMKTSCSILGINEFITLNYPDNRLDTISKMDLSIELTQIIQDYEPELILTHHPGDYNWDHKIVFDATMMAARPNYPDHIPSSIWTFEVPSSTERSWQSPLEAFHPNMYINIEKTIDSKKRALKTYKSEYRSYPHPRSIESLEYLARKRGVEVGFKYAESFHTIRTIEH